MYVNYTGCNALHNVLHCSIYTIIQTKKTEYPPPANPGYPQLQNPSSFSPYPPASDTAPYSSPPAPYPHAPPPHTAGFTAPSAPPPPAHGVWVAPGTGYYPPQ